jgi:hypothetical protein
LPVLGIQFQNTFHHRGGSFYIGMPPDLQEEIFREGRSGALQAPLRLSGHSLHPIPETFQGTGGGQRDAEENCGAQGNAQDAEKSTSRVFGQVTPGKTKPPEFHGCTWPSLR